MSKYTFSDIPKKMEKKTIVYDSTYRWMLYKPDQNNSMLVEPCVDCSRTFYGSDSKIILTLHRILFHEKEADLVG